MRVKFDPHFLRSLSKFTDDVRDEFNKRLAIFQQNPFDKQLRTHKLSGRLSGLWSFSITHSHRVVFSYKDGIARFLDIGDHRVYR